MVDRGKCLVNIKGWTDLIMPDLSLAKAALYNLNCFVRPSPGCPLHLLTTCPGEGTHLIEGTHDDILLFTLYVWQII